MKNLLLLALLATIYACSHPIEIVGEGDVLSATGTRNCYLEDFQAKKENCTKNLVQGAYNETYYAVSRPGWEFDKWINYCADAVSNECAFVIPADAVQNNWGTTVPALVAVFNRLPVTPPVQPPTFPSADQDGNVSFATAKIVSDQSVTNDTVSSSSDADYFKFTAGETAYYSVSLEFSKPDVSLYWYNDDANKTLVGESKTSGATKQIVEGKRLEKGKTYYIGVQASSQSSLQTYKLTITRGATAPAFPDGTALYSYQIDAKGFLVDPKPLHGARLQRKTAYFSYYGDYKQISFWCCKTPQGSEGHAPREEDSTAPFVMKKELTTLLDDDGLQRELYADFFYSNGSVTSDNTAYWTLEPMPKPAMYEVRVTGRIYHSTNTDFIPIGTAYTLNWTYYNHENATGHGGGVCTDPYVCRYLSGIAVYGWHFRIENTTNAAISLSGRDGMINVVKGSSGNPDSVSHYLGERCAHGGFGYTGGFNGMDCADFTLTADAGSLLSSPSLVYPIPASGWDDIGASLSKAIDQGVSSGVALNYNIKDPIRSSESASGTISTLVIRPVE